MPASKIDLDFVDSLKSNEFTFVLDPQIWKRFRQFSRIQNWERRKLIQREKTNIPPTSGVYSLLVHQNVARHPFPQYVMYIGQTDNLRRRFGEYLGKEKRLSGRPLVVRMLNKFEDNIFFAFTKVGLAHLDKVESNLLQTFLPPCCDPDEMPAKIRKSVKAARLS
jgi:hypothetical protein